MEQEQYSGQIVAGTIRSILYPRSIAVLGVRSSPQQVGYNIFESIIYGGFAGDVYPVHPRLKTVLDRKVYPSLAEIPGQVDLAVIALNEKATISALEECEKKGIRHAVCVAGGYREIGGEGEGLEKTLQEVATRTNVSFIGPNTLGFINNEIDLNATFYPMILPKGKVSFISQSGGLGLTFLHRAADAGLGINKWIGAGNRSNFSFSDYLSFLGADEGTGAIGLFLEGAEDARSMVYRAAQIKKPVVVYKAGRSEEIDRSTFTHTGSMSGSYRVYRDIFSQFNIQVADSVMELVAVLKALSLSPLPAGGNVGLMTHTAGPGIVAADLLFSRGHRIPDLTAKTLESLHQLAGKNPPVVLRNPLDVAGMGFRADIYRQYLELLATDPNVDLVLAIYCQHKNWRFPTAEIIEVKEKVKKPFVVCYSSPGSYLEKERPLLEGRGIPLFNTPEEAAWAASALIDRFSRLQRSQRGPGHEL